MQPSLCQGHASPWEKEMSCFPHFLPTPPSQSSLPAAYQTARQKHPGGLRTVSSCTNYIMPLLSENGFPYDPSSVKVLESSDLGLKSLQPVLDCSIIFDPFNFLTWLRDLLAAPEICLSFLSWLTGNCRDFSRTRIFSLRKPGHIYNGKEIRGGNERSLLHSGLH